MKKAMLTAALFYLATQSTAFAGQQINVKVNGLVCDFCAQAIGVVLKRDPAVSASRINLNSKIVTIDLNNGGNLSNNRINQLISSAGYNVVNIMR